MLDLNISDLRQHIIKRSKELGLSQLQRGLLLARFKILPFDRIHKLLPQKGRVLEVGSGHGILSLAMAMMSRERKVFGLDLSPGRVELAQKLVQGFGLSPEPEFVLGDAKGIPLGQEPYAALFMAEVLYLVPYEEQKDVFRSAGKALSSNGIFVVCELVIDWSVGSFVQRAVSRVLTIFSMSSWGRTLFGYRVKGAPFLRTKEGWLEIFQTNGFNIETVEIVRKTIFPHILIRGRKR
ncbi:MAG: class I SAM-dependent methyltransferase [Candidatus Omnitrophica bacterium]|nr:class I SAM-dependent methyltransferase [Candidatus Omnitrophota bacterium]